MRVKYSVLYDVLVRILQDYGFNDECASLCARLIAESNLDGYESHGLNRFPTFIRGINRGYIKIGSEPELAGKTGLTEHWDGRLGPGNLNAYFCMNRAIQLADEYGMGCVSLKNTNHWLRGGTYGWQAANAGKAGICWTNTKPNMPPWGAQESKVGNNPIVLAVPSKTGHIVLDMAMSQFSYGKMETSRRAGELLPFPGGYDSQGNLTRDPAEIEKTERTLPVGFWKGSGLALLLDLIVTMVSGGDPTFEIGNRGHEYGLSQIFIAIDPANQAKFQDIVKQIIENYKSARPIAGETVYYPGERTLMRREENLRLGVPVNDLYWKQVRDLLKD